MRAVLGAGLLALGVASCTEPIPIAYPPAPPPPPPAPAPPPEPPAPPPAPWALVFERGCHDSITPPVLSPDGAAVASCGALFSADRGRFLGRAPANLRALLDGGRAVVDPHETSGPGVVEPGREQPRTAPGGGSIHGLAFSPDRARVLSLETDRLNGDRSLILRELPSLKELRRTSLGPGPTVDPVLGFLPDGRELFLGAVGCTIEDCTTAADKKQNRGCSRPRCPEPALLVIEGGKAAPLSPALGAITTAVLAGERALLVRADGAVAVVELPSGREIAALPWPKDVEPSALALAPGGDRAAVAADGRLAVFARAGASYQQVLDARRPFTRTLAFAADGRSLYTGDDLSAYREGATPPAVAADALDLTPPPGFTRIPRTAEGFAWDGGSRSVPLGAVAYYREEKHGAEVMVVALDAGEHDPASDAGTWARAVAARETPYVRFEAKPKKGDPRLTAWGEPGARGALVVFTGDGCDPMDHHIRFQEREGRLWVVTLMSAPGLSEKRLTAWRAAFMDAPLGAAPASAVPAKKPAKKAEKKPAKKKAKR